MLELPVFVSCRAEDGLKTAEWLQDVLQGRSLIVNAGSSAQTAVLSLYVPRPSIADDTTSLEELDHAWVWLLVCTPGAMHEFPHDDRLYRDIRWWIQNRSGTPPILILPLTSRWIPEIVLRQWPTPEHIELPADTDAGRTPAERDFAVTKCVDKALTAISNSVASASASSLIIRPGDTNALDCGADVPGLYTWQKDKYLRYIDVNEHYARAAGYDSPKAMLGKTDHDMAWHSLADFFQAGDRQVISGAAAARINVQETEIMVDRIADILVTERPLFDSKGKCVGLSGFFADITGHILVPRPALTPGEGVALGPEFGNESLSAAEVEVFKGMLRILTAEQIASAHSLTVAAVESHVAAIKRKLQCTTDGDVITTAIRSGLPLSLFGPALVTRPGPLRRGHVGPAPMMSPSVEARSGPAHMTYVLAQPRVPELKCYTATIVEGWRQLPECRPLDHTMFEAIDEYVRRKLPVDEIKEIIAADGRVEVHGIFPDDFMLVAPSLGLTSMRRVESDSAQQHKRFNSVRPVFYECVAADSRKTIAVAVPPGRDYVLHYAAMIRHAVVRDTRRAEELISITRYPDAERELPTRTGLSALLVSPCDRVLLGYVEEIKAYLDDESWALSEGAIETAHYGSYRYRLPDGSVLNLLGVKYSFWGSISEILVREMCRLGAIEILYVAKLGALTSPADIYQRIFCPSEFVILQHDEVAQFVVAPPNAVLEKFPDLQSGCHVSVATVLEEDYMQRQVTTKLTANSIDNEISRMAKAVSGFSRLEGAAVVFSAIHFATDYIREPSERNRQVQFDLATNRSESARQAKASMLSRIWHDVLAPYLTSVNPEA